MATTILPEHAAAVSAAVSFAALVPAHLWGDYWAQHGDWATLKGEPGWRGRLNCAAHVINLTGWKLLSLLAVQVVTHGLLSWAWVLAALTVDAATHYVIDRRTPLERLADWLDRTGLVPGKSLFARFGDKVAAPCGTGAHAMDQAWHYVWLWIAALIIAAGS